MRRYGKPARPSLCYAASRFYSIDRAHLVGESARIGHGPPTAPRRRPSCLSSASLRTYASTPVLSSTWGASLLAPAATGAGLRLLSEDASPPNFPARLGLHPT